MSKCGVNNRPEKRVSWISGQRPERHKHVSASVVAVVTGRIAPGLRTTHHSAVPCSKFDIPLSCEDRAFIML
jgi:hypothetical protein